MKLASLRLTINIKNNISYKTETKLIFFTAQNHPLAEDLDIARFSIDQISLLVLSIRLKGWPQRRDEEKKRERLRQHVVSRKLKLLYHQHLCQQHIKWSKYCLLHNTVWPNYIGFLKMYAFKHIILCIMRYWQPQFLQIWMIKNNTQHNSSVTLTHIQYLKTTTQSQTLYAFSQFQTIFSSRSILMLPWFPKTQLWSGDTDYSIIDIIDISVIL